ncbi:MAG: hypothetical protein ACYTGZ_06620 [Planctomycetota bacterium]|jgi:hypothetical protein
MRCAALVSLVLAASGCGGADPAHRDAYNRAFAALHAGQVREAESALDAIPDDAGSEVVAHRDFLRGNVKFEQCLVAERQASTAEAEPFAFDIAITFARRSAEAWRAAAMSRADWPEARRNVERALLKRAELHRRKAQAEERQRRKNDPTPKPKPQPKKPPPEGPPEKKDEPAPEKKPGEKELSPDQVRGLIETLAKKETEKVALRRSQQRKRAASVERDW